MDVPAALACPKATVRVRDSAQLTAALGAAGPGTVILAAPGNYPGKFTLRARGTQPLPIWLCGPGAVLSGPNPRTGTGLHLDGAAWVNVLGVEVTGQLKGIMVDRSQHVVIQGTTVHHIGNEAIHLRTDTTDSLVLNNTVHDTGLTNHHSGEGIYVGSAVTNWGKLTGGRPDASHRNTIAGNRISATTAESIDIKEGTRGGRILRNTFDGSGLATDGADSWVDVKGNGWVIALNTGTNSLLDGFQVHQIVPGEGQQNLFIGNSGAGLGKRPGPHPAVLVALVSGRDNRVRCDNRVSGGVAKVTKAACAP